MSRLFTADRPGPVTLDLDVTLGEVHVVTENREHAELTLEPANPDDATARDLIDRTTLTTDAGTFGVAVPRPAGTRSTSSVVQAGHISGVVISSADGIIVNGQPVDTAASAGAVTVTARLPHCSSVSMRTSSAELLTTGALARVAYRSESGSLVTDLAGTVESHTVSGGISVSDAGTVRASTTSGSVLIGQTDEITARTVSGTIDIAGLRGTGRAESVSGSIQVHAITNAALTASTISGPIHLTAADGVTFRTRPSTVSGRIHQPHTQRWSA